MIVAAPVPTLRRRSVPVTKPSVVVLPPSPPPVSKLRLPTKAVWRARVMDAANPDALPLSPWETPPPVSVPVAEGTLVV